MLSYHARQRRDARLEQKRQAEKDEREKLLCKFLGKENYDSLKGLTDFGNKRNALHPLNRQEARRLLDRTWELIEGGKELQARLLAEGIPQRKISNLDSSISFAYDLIVEIEMGLLAGFYDPVSK